VVPRRLVVSLTLAIAACIIPDIDWEGRACTSTCPDSFVCRAGVCTRSAASFCPKGAVECLDFEDGGTGQWAFTSEGTVRASFQGAFSVQVGDGGMTPGFGALSRTLAAGEVSFDLFIPSISSTRAAVIFETDCGGPTTSLRLRQLPVEGRELELASPATTLSLGRLDAGTHRFTVTIRNSRILSGDAGLDLACATPTARLGLKLPIPQPQVTATIDDVVVMP
jgi:hypothetical protein